MSSFTTITDCRSLLRPKNPVVVLQFTVLSICLFAFSCTSLSAQQAGASEVNRGLLEKGIYRFAAFTEGTVVFRNGTTSAARLNYNISMDEMHFIRVQGDTLSLADPLTIDFVSIADTRFYYERGNGYLQVIDTANKITLAFKQSFIEEPQHAGAFGMTVPHEGATTYNYFTSKGEQYKLDENDKVTLSTKETYFFSDGHKHFVKAGKEFILDHYSKSQTEIKTFLKENHTSFSNAEDIMKLLQYCARLST